MDQAEVDRLLKNLDDEHRKDREAILRVQRLLNERAPSDVRVRTRVPVIAVDAAPENFSQVVREAVEKVSGRFTTHDIRDAVQQALPGFDVRKRMTSISSILLGLLEDEKIKLVQKGVGAKPSTYER
jgi:hypothetical protein